MGTHLVGRVAGGRLLLVILAAFAALTATAASAAPASALGSPVLLTITVAPAVVSVPSGETEQFTATGHYSNLSTEDLTDTVTWSSSSTATATISNASGSQGLATAAGTGLATIKAADASVSGTGVMTVLPAVLLTVTVSPLAASIPVGETEQFTATGHYSDGTKRTSPTRSHGERRARARPRSPTLRVLRARSPRSQTVPRRSQPPTRQRPSRAWPPSPCFPRCCSR